MGEGQWGKMPPSSGLLPTAKHDQWPAPQEADQDDLLKEQDNLFNNEIGHDLIMESKRKSKTITHAYMADSEARTRSHLGADQDYSIGVKTRQNSSSWGMTMITLPRLSKNSTTLVPKEGEWAG